MTFTQLNATAGATLNVTGTNLGTATNKVLFGTAPAQTNGIIPNVTFGGTTFATYGGVNGLAAAATAAMPTNVGSASTNAVVTSAGATLTGNTIINSLVLQAGAALNLGGNTLTIVSGGILAMGASVSITNGTILFSTGVANSVVQGFLLTDGQAATSVTISASITGLGGLAISAGASNVTLSGANSYSVANGNAVQTLTLGGTITSGTFTLQYNGQTTAPIAWTAVAATLAGNIQTALAALSNIGAGNVSVLSAAGVVTNGTATLFLINFVGALAAVAQPQISVVSNALTGTSPTVAIAVANTGAYGTVLNSGNLILGSAGALPSATLSAAAPGSVTNMTITGAGSYIQGANAFPTITLSAGNAAATATGSVTGVTSIVGGSNYSANTTVVFSAPPTGGVTATGTVTVLSGVITGITITNPGSGYAAFPTITFQNVGSGVGASAAAIVGVTGVVITNPGNYSTGLPTAAFSAGTVTATATILAAGAQSGRHSGVRAATFKMPPAPRSRWPTRSTSITRPLPLAAARTTR